MNHVCFCAVIGGQPADDWPTLILLAECVCGSPPRNSLLSTSSWFPLSHAESGLKLSTVIDRDRRLTSAVTWDTIIVQKDSVTSSPVCHVSVTSHAFNHIPSPLQNLTVQLGECVCECVNSQCAILHH